MLLNNYKKVFLPQNNINLKNYKGENTTLAGVAYSGRPVLFMCSQVASWGGDIPACRAWLDVGTGDTPETVDDYIMTDMNMFTAALSVLSLQSLARTEGEIISLNMLVKNNGSVNVTVREVGIVANPSTSQVAWPTSLSNANYECLLFRKVLDTPVTIAPGDSYSITYTVRFKDT